MTTLRLTLNELKEEFKRYEESDHGIVTIGYARVLWELIGILENPASVAQGIEQITSKDIVAGSSPAGSTIQNDRICIEGKWYVAVDDYKAANTNKDDIEKAVNGLRDKLPKVTLGDSIMPVETRIPHLLFMLQEIPKMEREKAMRWLGYVQGVMVARGWLDVEEERDRTRPIFNKTTELP